ncbi:hypothetical protein SPBR_05420 [Sporothrix brasiliensis 5110]|uniref:Uncharacterized protein n=1 Tax=Sporothrix brasiliensis 5110 TaxID=1398154 RepID=A0A0C2IDU5_9PEZI|nr:uncharacterized protein SPBR_05420 [Sporothrix brasiliensis 5110]KIH87441.1 hypothetical protein SPBR_05420 [Sporothrix brasiliensis 5110]
MHFWCNAASGTYERTTGNIHERLFDVRLSGKGTALERRESGRQSEALLWSALESTGALQKVAELPRKGPESHTWTT